MLRALGYKSEISKTRLTVAPEASVPEAPESPKAETAPVASPEVAEASKSAPAAAETTETKTPATPPAAPPLKAQPKKQLSPYKTRTTDEAGVTTEIENLEYWHFPSRGQKGFKPGGRGKPAFKGKRKKGAFKGPKPRHDSPKGNKPPTQRQVENSPFAALAALKTPKKD